MIKGIDVSAYQSDAPNLSGADFCFVKATEGTSYINPRMSAQAAHARKAGLVVGFYHFVQPGDMKAQAAFFVEKAASKPGDILWLDWEHPGVSCAQKDAFIREVQRLRGSTHRVGLYCNTSYWTTRDTTSFYGDALWIAVYNGRPGNPGIKATWRFHQYTDKPVDTSVSTFASRAELRAWANKQTTSTTKEENMDPRDVWAYKNAKKLAADGGGAESEDAYQYLRTTRHELRELAKKVDSLAKYKGWDYKGKTNLAGTGPETRDAYDYLRRVDAKLDALAAAVDALAKKVG